MPVVYSQLLQKQKENKELDLNDVKYIVRQAAELGVQQITLTGGEPFLRKDLMEIVEEIKDKRLHWQDKD